MFGTIEVSSKDRRRYIVAILSGLLAHVLVIGATFLVGLLFPNALPIHKVSYALTWLQALRPTEKPVTERPRRSVRVIVPTVKRPRNSFYLPWPS